MRTDHFGNFLNFCVIGGMYAIAYAWFVGTMDVLIGAWGGWCIGSAFIHGVYAFLERRLV